ncbi:hypothetical protein RchiOBHm_Chr7g0235321 [Rosa chinensis]|uniref:Uncharacterized protein n=1 Tax=Rosa chinensis TaxID=74649 RepID=A0A2P6PGN8_ROSCH|nr:hypothetical protein RchiOBHm_Chr7g0235321 [Rosa chinensis]
MMSISSLNQLHYRYPRSMLTPFAICVSSLLWWSHCDFCNRVISSAFSCASLLNVFFMLW